MYLLKKSRKTSAPPTIYNGKTYATTIDVPVEIIARELSLDVPTVLGFEEAFTQKNKRQGVSREDPDWAIKVEDTRAPSQRTNWDLNVRIVDDFTLGYPITVNTVYPIS